MSSVVCCVHAGKNDCSKTPTFETLFFFNHSHHFFHAPDEGMTQEAKTDVLLKMYGNTCVFHCFHIARLGCSRVLKADVGHRPSFLKPGHNISVPKFYQSKASVVHIQQSWWIWISTLSHSSIVWYGMERKCQCFPPSRPHPAKSLLFLPTGTFTFHLAAVELLQKDSVFSQ